MSHEAGSNGFASVNQPAAVKRLRVLTVNTHKGFTAFNRRFILPELREASRARLIPSLTCGARRTPSSASG